MVKKSLIWLYSATIWLLWFSIILVASVLLGYRYFVLPAIPQYKDAIARYASQATGQTISIGNIHASLSGLQPRLDLYQVQLYDTEGRSALILDHVQTSLSWLSLVRGEVRLSQLAIHKPHLTMRRKTDGTIYFAGIPMGGQTLPEFATWLLRQSSIDIHDATVIWQDELRGAPPLELRELSLRFISPPLEGLFGRHRFGLRATPSSGATTPLDIRGNLLMGKELDQPERWRGTIYARLEGTDLAAWNRWVSYPFEFTRGTGATQLLLEFSHGRIDKLVADVALRNIVGRLSPLVPPSELSSLTGRVHWTRLTDGQELRAERLRLAAEGISLQDGELRLANRDVGGKVSVEGDVRLADIRLEQLAAFAGRLPLAPETQEMLAAVAPMGRLQPFALKWRGTPEKIETFSLNGRFTDFSMAASRGLPGFVGLSGSVEATQDGGNLSLTTAQAELDFPGVLRTPIPLDKLSGLVSWKAQEGRLAIRFSNLAITTPHLSGTLNASYQHSGKGRGNIDLTARFGRVDLRYVSRYYPLVLSQNTLDWLDTSILGGRGENVNIVVKGDLDDFPWHTGGKGLFQVSADISNGILHYAEGWPSIEDIKLNMLFRGNRMELNASQGRIYGNRIKKAKIVIPALDAKPPILEVNGEVEGLAAELLRFVNTSPVLGYLDHFPEKLQASGNSNLALDLRIPLDETHADTKVSGSLTLANASLAADQTLPRLEKINGRLDFTEAGLKADSIRAEIYGNPLQFSLVNTQDGGLRVAAQGRIDDAGIRRLSDHPLTRKIHGSTFWTAQIRLLQDGAEVKMQSPLTGLSLALPPPFGKSAAQSVALKIESLPQPNDQELLTIAYGKIASAQLMRTTGSSGKRIERGEVSLGESPARLPDQPGITLRGHLEHLDWDQWRDLGGSQNIGGGLIRQADLTISALDVFGRRISDLKLDARAITGGWMVDLVSREIVGKASLSDATAGNDKVVARLKSLRIPPPAPAKLSAPGHTIRQELDYPALDIVAESFEYKGKELGRLELQAKEEGNSWKINKLAISNPDSMLAMDGEWRNWRKQPNTRINLHWQIIDLGKTLERYGYADIIRAGTADVHGQLQWPSSPHEFGVAKLNGNLALKADSGQFLKIKPGVGRLFSVVSLQNLPRRLILDFSDVFSAGFSFDRIAGDVRIENGIMQTDNFIMEGTTATVAISGSTDLDKETQNLRIKVTPLLSDSLSLAALAGGPAVGAAAFIAQKVLKDPFSKLVSYEYEITGTWDDPKALRSSKQPRDVLFPFPTSGE